MPGKRPGLIGVQEKRHMQRFMQAVETEKPPPLSQRRYGSGWQKKPRDAERAIKVAAVAFKRWAAKHAIPIRAVAEALGISERTLSAWEHSWEHNRLKALPRGRRTQPVPIERRNEVIAGFSLMGPHVGANIIKALDPELPERLVEDLVRRLKHLYSQTHVVEYAKLHWRKAGTVWAIDHATPPAPIEGCYAQVLSVRDLAAQTPLAWTPVPDASALHVRLVLEALMAEHGVPLLLKKDNGSALNDAALNRLLDQKGVVGLLSPRATPQYNGSCEAGIGSLKHRTSYEAARNGRAGRWTMDDCETARLQAYRTARPWGVNGPTPEQAWLKREPSSPELRQRFQKAVPYFWEEERRTRGHLPGIDLPWNIQASMKRVAIRRALVALRLLKVRKGRITLPFSI